MQTVSQSQRTWRPRRVSYPEDRALLQRARTALFGRPDERYLDWLYGANPAGSVCCRLAMDGDAIAGQYAVIPLDMVAGGRAFKAALSVDTFTHEAYRRQGVLAALAAAVFAELASAGYRVTIGFPNASAHRTFVTQAGFRESFGIHAMTRPLARMVVGPRLARAVARTFRGIVGVSGLRIDAPASVPAAWIDRLWAERRAATRIGIAKTGAWFQWRFAAHPRVSYRYLTAARGDGTPAGVLVWTPERGERGRRPAALVMDLEATTPRIGAGLLRALVHELPDDVQVLHAFATRWSAFGRSLLRAGFVPRQRFPFLHRAHGVDADLDRDATERGWSLSAAYMDTL